MKLMLPLLFSLSCAQFGTPPNKEDLKRIQTSPQYDIKKDKFINRRPDIREKMRKKIGFKIYKKWLFGESKDRFPSTKLPEGNPKITEFVKTSDNIKVIWLGHSTLLLNIEGKIILIDPVFSDSASPFSFAIKRFQPPVIKLHDLPKIDFIVISHDHYDHLDKETIEYFKDKKTRFLLPLGVGSHLKGWGIDPKRLVELDWWQKKEYGGFEFIATPAQHFSGRSLSDQDATLWASWIIKKGKRKIFFSGDSGYDTHFKTIGDKYGPFDLAFLDSGQYNLAWEPVHMLPPQVGKATLELKAQKLIPIHWGMFSLSFHSWYEPPVKIKKQAEIKGIDLLTPKLGEMITLKDKTTHWWEDLVSGTL